MNTDKALKIWHEHFKNEKYRYSEFENSDIEYFIACLLYNHFQFKNSLSTMKTIDLSYEFLSASAETYDDVLGLIKNIEINSEVKKINFLLNFIQNAISKYNKDELYLLYRLKYHTDGIYQRYLENNK